VLTGGGSEVRPELAPSSPRTAFVATVRGFTVHSVNATHASHSYVWAARGVADTEPGLPGRIVHQVVVPLRPKARA